MISHIVVAWCRGKRRCDILSLHSSAAPVGLEEDLPRDAHMSRLGRDQWDSAAAPGISRASGAECTHSACAHAEPFRASMSALCVTLWSWYATVMPACRMYHTWSV